MEHAKIVTTLRSGKIINKDIPKNVSQSKENSETKGDVENKEEEPVHKPIAPFPQRLLNLKKGAKNNDILEVLKQVKVNIPLLDAIKQIPSYAKILKDLCTVKRRHHVHKKAFLIEQVSAILQNNMPVIQRSRLSYYLLYYWKFLY
jgi:hypothetical protein